MSENCRSSTLPVQLEKNSGMSKEDTKKLIITNYPAPSAWAATPWGKGGGQTLFQQGRFRPDPLRVYCACIHHQESLQTQSHIRTRKQCGTQRIVLQYMYEQGLYHQGPAGGSPWPMMYTTGYRTWIQPPRGLTVITAILRTNSLSRSSVP